MEKPKKDFIKNPPKDLKPPKVAENSLEIMRKRSLLKDSEGNLVETPLQMFWRVAASLAWEDKKYKDGEGQYEETAKQFYQVLSENKFLPGARVLYEAGNEIDGTGQLSSCFVLPIEDSLDNIFNTMREAALVQKNNGGTGFNFSHIRPKGDDVGGTPNVAAGPLHFIRSFSQSFDHILQGKKRGGGNMAILNVNHPDILDFINLKGRDSSIRNFNLSVGITDDFMQAIKNDENYELINPRTQKPVKKLSARGVFDLICQKAWECADPGLFFLDTAERTNPTPELGIIEATNPCGEEPLRAYESCNLGSIVLPSHLTTNKTINWKELRQSVHKAIHFLDNMIDLSIFPLDKIAGEVEKTRKLGLGVVGLATLLYEMQIPYNSSEAVNLVSKIVKFIQEESEKESMRLAETRGVFPAYKGSKWGKQGKKVRNATMTSIAPTGTLSLIANTSSGIEPVFSLVYKYRGFYQDDGKEDHKQLLYVNEQFKEYARKHKFYSKELVEQIANNEGSIQNIEDIPEHARKIFVVTHDIEPSWHVKMQAAAQKYIDAAVSKTINLPQDASVDDIRRAYITAWETGCKGITIYRDGSKQLQVLEVKTQIEEKPEKEKILLKPHQEENFQLTQNAIQVLEKRALKRNEKDEIVETPNDLWERIARYVAGAEMHYDGRKARKYEKMFYDIMAKGEFLSGGTLIYAGLGPDAIMSKCLVLPISDSIDAIFSALNKNIQMLRRGVGTGFNFSSIRSTYAKVSTTGEYAAGPLEYLKMFNRAQDTIKGRGGRGLGSMAILNVSHPNIEEFIGVKDDLEGLSHYNISVGVTNKFMKAVKEDKEWKLIDPHTNEVCKTVNARKVFEQIAKHAWTSGDPGIFFIDQAEKGNTTPSLGSMDATNPCGEQPLIPYETCNLGNIDVSKFIKGFPFAEDVSIKNLPLNKKLELVNWEHLEEVVKLGVRFLDNIIDINNYPIIEIEEMTKRTRNIGLGIMGFADFLIKLGISYAEDEANEAARALMKFIQEKAQEASEEIGKEKGNFPAFKESTWNTKFNKKFMRNTRTTTIAPTGSISIIANCNPGIEPIFALGYRRKNSMGGQDQEVIEHLFEQIAKNQGFYSEGLLSDIANGRPLSEIQIKYNIPKEIIDVFVTTHEIKPKQHVRIQAAFQKYIDSAVSKTINLPSDATWQSIAKVYELAYDLGCKGITIFRDGSKDPALQVGIKDKQKQQVTEQTDQSANLRNSAVPRKRPEITRGFTYQIDTNQGHLFVTINEDDQGMFEVFLQGVGKSGSFTSGYIEAIGRLVSMALRSGIEVEQIIGQLQGIRSGQPTMNPGGVFVYSVPDAVAKILKKHLNESQQFKMFNGNKPQVEATAPAQPQPEQEKLEEKLASIESTTKIKPQQEENAHSKYSAENKAGDLLECPECGGDLEYAEGCVLCRSCGFSRCG